jgi:hypothetical protein
MARNGPPAAVRCLVANWGESGQGLRQINAATAWPRKIHQYRASSLDDVPVTGRGLLCTPGSVYIRGRQLRRPLPFQCRLLTQMYGPAARCKRFSSSCRFAVLHQCIRPLIGAFAPGHHGYQRACVLISGQASSGPFGSPVFACAGKTEPPSRLILSQTSAGNC